MTRKNLPVSPGLVSIMWLVPARRHAICLNLGIGVLHIYWALRHIIALSNATRATARRYSALVLPRSRSCFSRAILMCPAGGSALLRSLHVLEAPGLRLSLPVMIRWLTDFWRLPRKRVSGFP